LRQFDTLHREKKNISIGFIGYPNVGKSSIINTLKKQACCKAAPIPGETRVWQYVSLTKRIYLIDCPGVVNDNGDSTEKVLKSVLRAEKIDDPTIHVQGILAKAKKEYLQKIYKIKDWVDHEDFVSQIAVSYGKLFKGGEPNLTATSKMILMDWQRGKIPYFVPPPKEGEIGNLIENEENQKDIEVDLGNGFDMNKKYNIEQDIGDLIVTNEFGNNGENKTGENNDN
jgi:nuclear GTP-binding protein